MSINKNNTAILFHDGCNICLAVSATFEQIMQNSDYHFDSVNLDMDNSRGNEAIELGVIRLPSLVVDGKVWKIDDHSSIEDYV